MIPTRPNEPTPGRRARGSSRALGLVASALVALVLPSAVAAADPAAFPLTVTDDEGTEVTIDALPERIISFSPANTEIVFTLGAGDRLVGGTDADDYPP